MMYINRDNAIRTAIDVCIKVVGHGITQIDAAEIADAIETIPAIDFVAELEKLVAKYRHTDATLLKSQAETIKGFAESFKKNLKAKCNPYGKPTLDYGTTITILNYLDNLVKERVGE